MPQSKFLTSLLQGTANRNVRLTVARGLVPLPPEELLELLIHLLKDRDSEVADQAKRTLSGWSEPEIATLVQQRGCSPSLLQYYASSSASLEILQGIILNQATPATIIESLAERIPEALLELILDNKVRLLEFPGILSRVKLNPEMTPQIARLVQELETEFFSGKRRDYSVETPGATAAGLETAEQEEEQEQELGDLSLEGLPLDPEERELALQQRLAKMPVRKKIHYALMGTREARSILIRDSNKEVAHSVLRSPKLMEQEVESFSAMRNISDDILRAIGSSREWTHNYTIVQNLVKNPKTPPLVSQRMLFRIHSKDLMHMSRDRSLPEMVRRNAQRALSQRTAHRPN